jgi:hypothetical protein
VDGTRRYPCRRFRRSWFQPSQLICIPLISDVALAVLSASFLTSSATTANPRPCSPALAASMAAFNASRLVGSAMSLITAIISPICLERSPSVFITFTGLSTVAEIAFDSLTDSLTTSAPSLAIFAVSVAEHAIFDEFLAISIPVISYKLAWALCANFLYSAKSN